MNTINDMHTQIAICGAGPIGLLLGNLLGQMGFHVTILEQRLHRPNESMAIGITPPSLKILEQLNLSDVFLDRGRPIQNASVYESCRHVGAMSFACLHGDYPFILSLPQAETIDILEHHLQCYPNVTLLRGVRLDEINQQDNQVELKIWNTAQGHYDTLTTHYLIGCDGVRSRVRRQAGIQVSQRTYPHDFLMADFDDLSGLGNRACLFFTPEGGVESFPLPGHRRRWIVQLDGLTPEEQARPDIVETLVLQRSDVTLSGSHKRFESRFRAHRMLARRYYRARSILCGDAAHCMSPVGGQGMNTGFADAALLAESLNCIMHKQQPSETLLRYYEQDRKRAYRVAAFRAARNMWLGTRRGFIGSRLRYHLLHTLLQQPEAFHLAEHFAMLTIPCRQLAHLTT